MGAAPRGAATTTRDRNNALNDDPQPQVEEAFGFLMVNPPPVMVSTKSTSAPFR